MIHLKQIVKSILKYKIHSGLSLLSLVVAFTGIIILSLYISFEESFDSFHQNESSVFRLETVMYGNHLPAKLDEFLNSNFSEIDESTVFCFAGKENISTSNLIEQNISFSSKLLIAQNSFFTIFSFPLKTGNVETVLSQPFSVVISETLSGKLFGNNNSVGETIVYNQKPYKVVGIMEDFPENSSFRADCIVSFSTLLKENDKTVNSWGDWNFDIYLKLTNVGNAPQLAKAIGESSDLPEVFEGLKGQYPGQDFFLLEPLPNIHFKNSEYNYYYAYTNPLILNILIGLVVVLAMMGIVNFINLSTAQAPLRSKALAILQVMGAKKFSSMKQVIAESILISLLALAVSVILYLFVFQYIGSLFDINGLSLKGRYYYLIGFVLFALAYGIVAGIYPAFYITSVPIVRAVKGNALFRGKGKVIRNGLVVLQFIFTIALIISAFVIEKQLVFWRNFDIGINKEHVVYLNTSKELKNHSQAFADELVKTGDVVGYTYSQFAPGQVGMGWGREIDGQFVQFRVWPIDDNFIDFFDIKIDAGRKFSENNKVDINNFIINDKAVSKFGWSNPLERKISGFEDSGNIVGVVKDFNFSSLKDNLEPMVFWRSDENKDVLLLRLKAGNSTQAITQINKIAKDFDPQYQGEVKFLNEELQQQYSKEERTARFIELVAFWCILLAFAGILGLMIFVSRDRVKEIGIRKVNGAKISEILTMLNRDFIKWVAIAFVIACPIAWYAMNKWLENFAYKTTLSWWIFALAGVLALVIALLTVSWQSWRAATRNPVEALRYE